MKPKILTLILALLLIPVAFVTETKGANVEWRFQLADFNIEQEPAAKIMVEQLIPAVKARTNGNFIIKPYWLADLGLDVRNYPHALSSGAIDVAFTCPAYYMSDIPLIAMMIAPMMFSDLADYKKYSYEVLYDKITAAYKKTYAGAVGYLGPQPCNWSEVVTKKPIENMGDWKIKIRCPDPLASQWVKLLGGLPTITTWAEMVPSLQQNVIDGVVTTFTMMTQIKLYEQCKHVYLLHPWCGENHLLVRNASLNSLPENYRNILLEEVKKANKACWDTYIPNNAEQNKAIEVWQQNGAIIHKIPAAEMKLIEQKSKTMWDGMPQDDLGKAALAGYYKLFGRH
jgi:TRAP-type C4-dicarboxylate transport system substrate-binding protein